MVPETKDFGSTLQTVSRAVALLRCFEEGAARLTLAELTRRLGLNKATVFRLATTLESEGLLDKDPATGAYSVSYGLLALGRALLNPGGLSTLAQPILKAAQEETRETAILNLREGDRAVVVHEIVSPQAVRYALGVGYRADMRLGAASLAILAFLPGRETDAILAAPMPPTAGGATITAEDVRARLPRIRAEGYCITDSQRERDAAGFAAPVFGPDGTAIGSLSVVMPVSRARDAEHRRLCIDTVRAAARNLTARLGGDRAVG